MDRSKAIRFAVAFTGLGLVCAPACGVGAPGEESQGSVPVSAPEPGTSEAKQALPPAQCVTIQRGSLGNVADTQVASNTDASHPSGNFGAGPAAIGGTVGAGHRKALFQWDLSAVPPNLGITSATATLKAHSDSQGGPGNTLSVYTVTSSWSEGTVNWATQPSYNPTAIASDSGGPGTHTFDLTAQAQSWAGGGNDGILLDQDGYYYTSFYTSENALVSNHPALQVCYIPDLCSGVTCTASDACHVPGTCDANTGACSAQTPGNDGASCMSGTGTCSAGTCVVVSGDPCVNYGGTIRTVNSHIKICSTAIAWGSWNPALIPGAHVCTLSDWAAYAPSATPASLGMPPAGTLHDSTLWINGASCGSGNQREVFRDYPMNQASCYNGSDCCWPGNWTNRMAVCTP